jgi:hypothetical protein
MKTSDCPPPPPRKFQKQNFWSVSTYTKCNKNKMSSQKNISRIVNQWEHSWNQCRVCVSLLWRRWIGMLLWIVNRINCSAPRYGPKLLYLISNYTLIYVHRIVSLVLVKIVQIVWLQAEFYWWMKEVHPHSTDICWGFILSKDKSLSFSYCLRSKLPWRKPQTENYESDAMYVGSHGKILYFPSLSCVQHTCQAALFIEQRRKRIVSGYKKILFFENHTCSYF